MTENMEHSHITSSLRQRIFKLLNKNPILKPKELCILLNENYTKRGEVIHQYKQQWKKEYQSQRGLIRSLPDEVHNVFFKGKLGFEVVKSIFHIGKLNLPLGWRVSNARSRFWIFRNGLGRVRFFENGTVELWVRKPASDGKAMQLFSQAFTWTKLIDSISVVEEFQKTLMRRMHMVFDYGQRVPYMKITAFEETHKFSFVSGDKTHPTSAEFMVDYHNEVEVARRLFEQMQEIFKNLGVPNGVVKPIERDYSV